MGKVGRLGREGAGVKERRRGEREGGREGARER